MCGRFAQYTPPLAVASRFEVDPQHVLILDWAPRYNLAPSEQAMVVHLGAEEDGRVLEMMTWGFIPHWARDAEDMPHAINARAETVDSKPMFQNAFGSRRCLIPCDGFYDWKALKDRKHPYLIRLKEDGPFALAGLWDHHTDTKGQVATFTILVTAANDLQKSVHDRMPVILAQRDWDAWLSPATRKDAAKVLLKPFPPGLMTMHEVSRRVN